MSAVPDLSPPFEDRRIVGEVKWFNPVLGYGFVVCDEIDGDGFFHHTNVDQSGYVNPSDGDLMEFRPVATDEGWAARELRPIDPRELE